MSVHSSARWRIHVVNWKRLVSFLVILVLSITALILLLVNLSRSSRPYKADELSEERFSDLSMYFELEKDMEVPWHYLAAIDLAEGTPLTEISRERSAQIALHLTGLTDEEQLPALLAGYNDDKAFLRKVQREIKALSGLRAVYDNKTFPFAADVEYAYEDGYGDARSYGGERSHEGIDLMAEENTPILSVCDGVIEKVGWNELGGYRIGIRGQDKIYYYYAHMCCYEGNPKEGDKVKKGQLIGYVGDTGYGPEGTTGKFLPHLHFGMYYGKGGRLSAFNPYPFLKAWEKS
jgi:murein DD-endopeptidase MepM/ murein hydrolase activator NlpD